MKASRMITEITTLVLSSEESDWLQVLMQNPIKINGVNESLDNERMRERFFSALSQPEMQVNSHSNF